MAVFTTACFFSPLLLLLSFPIECICSNTINVTFADCLLVFYLNGNSTLAAAATALNLCFAGVLLNTVLWHWLHSSLPRIGVGEKKPTLATQSRPRTCQGGISGNHQCMALPLNEMLGFILIFIFPAKSEGTHCFKMLRVRWYLELGTIVLVSLGALCSFRSIIILGFLMKLCLCQMN